jgi:vancomycin resistance protein YoaR
MKPTFPTLLLASLLPFASQAAGAPATFQLVFSTQEPRLEGGTVRRVSIVKRWPLNAPGIAASRKAGTFSRPLSASLDRAQRQIGAHTPQPATFRNVGGHWIAVQRSGWTLERDRTKQNILKAILAGKSTAQAAVIIRSPQRSVTLLAERGVTEHVAVGRSSYRGSPPLRVTNILVGAQKLDNFFVVPGYTFDFAREVGDISASTGFVKGYVISGGTLERGDGGGICQVSRENLKSVYQPWGAVYGVSPGDRRLR